MLFENYFARVEKRNANDRTAESIEFDISHVSRQFDNSQFDRGIPFVGVNIELTFRINRKFITKTTL